MNLDIGEIYTNDEVMAAFKCSNSGGIRPSNTTNTIVLVSDNMKGFYTNRRDGDILYYTGTGRQGDQSLDKGLNKTLKNAPVDAKAIHLFEVFTPKQYIYRGEVHLNQAPYQEEQHDDNGLLRKVWVFPLDLPKNMPVVVTKEQVERGMKKKEKMVRELPENVVEKRAEKISGRPGKQQTLTTTYLRNSYVAEATKNRAKGHCELCEEKAPFADKNGKPYLESHHIKWLSKGGGDSMKNTAALCSNCHEKMHILDLPKDKKKLLNLRKKDSE